MAKRKLYGAALAAHLRKRGRRSSTALVRRSGGAVTRYRTRTLVVRPRRRRRRSFLGGGGGGGFVSGLKSQFPQLLGAAGYGWLTRGTSDTAADIRKNYISKLPVLDQIGQPASHGLLLHFIATQTGGNIRRGAGLLAHAALMQAAGNFGAAGGDVDKFVKMAGGNEYGDDEFSGAMDDYDDDVGADDVDDADIEGEGDDDPGEQ